jgi:signal transduction histidine kinase
MPDFPKSSTLDQMSGTRLTDRLSTIAGLVTYLAVGLPMLTTGLEPLSNFRLIVWVCSYIIFGVLFISEGLNALEVFHNRFPLVKLIAMTLLVTTCLFVLPQYNLTAILFIITAVEAAYWFTLKGGVLWISFQTLLILVATHAGHQVVSGGRLSGIEFVVVFTYFGFQAFALLSTNAALSEAKAKAELAQVNAELRATQALLTESSRIAERLRIARELHDLIGHHLTALSLNLEVARNLSEGKAHVHVEKARTLAKLLLSDVRDVVSSMRDDQTLDISRAIKTLTKDIPSPAVHLSVPPGLQLDDPARAQVLIRCIQEVITNAVRHANAENLWISVSQDGEALTISAHDDGRGTAAVTVGNGLKGMLERLETFGGTLNLASSPGQGFKLIAQLPLLEQRSL